MSVSFVGIGVQKCASSWLYHILTQHPDIRMSSVKEVDFFSSFYDRGYQWYESFFESGGLARGEISPSYFCDADAPKRIRKYNPEMKIIIALRDPMARVYSNHAHEVRLGQFSGSDISIEAGIKNNPMYIEQSKYGVYLARWFNEFPSDRITVVFQEEINEHSNRMISDMYSFLGVNSLFLPTEVSRKVNASYIPKHRKLEKSWQYIGKIGRNIGLRKPMDWLRNLPVIDGFINKSRLNPSLVIPPVRPETEAYLRSVFAEDIQQLKIVLNRSELPWKSYD